MTDHQRERTVPRSASSAGPPTLVPHDERGHDVKRGGMLSDDHLRVMETAERDALLNRLLAIHHGPSIDEGPTRLCACGAIPV
jgi:hypothetical protein